MTRPRVVIVGAGFGGLQCARALVDEPVDVLLIDRNNFHLFTPLLYQVASSLLDPSDIAYPVRAVFRDDANIRFRVADVVDVDRTERVLTLADGARVDYDYLVLATGSTTNFFGDDRIERRAFGLKDLPEALELRNHILRCFEAATRQSDPAARQMYLTFVVVGGGPTGVEYAGALAELVRLVLRRDYPELDVGVVDIQLIEAMDRLLPVFAPESGEEARRELEARGVRVRTSTRVEATTDDAIVLDDGGEIASHTLIWAAGVRVNGLIERLGGDRTPDGRIEVDDRLRVGGDERLRVIGDAAARFEEGEPLPMLAPPAMQQGRYAARAIVAALGGETASPFRYKDKGMMATIGRNAGVAETGRLKLHGFLGWVTWLVVHIYYLIGYRNRVAVLLRWAWEYVFYDRPVRIITRARER